MNTSVRPGYWVMLLLAIALLMLTFLTTKGCASIPNEPDTMEFKIAKGFTQIESLANFAADLYQNDLINDRELRWVTASLQSAHNALQTAMEVSTLDVPTAQIQLSVAIDILTSVQEHLKDEHRDSHHIDSYYRLVEVA